MEEIRSVVIKENNEPLVEITESDKMELLRDHKYLSPYLRRAVSERLVVAGNNLPEGYKLLVVTAYRPVWMQEELYKSRMRHLAIRHPLRMIFRHKAWKKMVNRYTAPPGGSSHQCGAAVDVTVLDKEGNRLDMGSSLTDYGERVHTHSNKITEIQRRNREVLYEAMTAAGFVNYPLEWWHYSYGDRMWSAYTSHGECPYGPVLNANEGE